MTRLIRLFFEFHPLSTLCVIAAGLLFYGACLAGCARVPAPRSGCTHCHQGDTGCKLAQPTPPPGLDCEEGHR